MRLPVICGLIERRILVNYRVDPQILAAILPQPFRPQLVRGFAVAGICLIRLREVRPALFPRWLGIGSENAAHRIAVEWDDGHQRRNGVYVVRRDTNSRLNAWAGGRIFPGLHHHGTFRVRESDSRFEVSLDSDDGQASMEVVADLSAEWPRDSIFTALSDASAFFEAGSLGYSPSREPGRYQGLELRCRSWQVQPLEIRSVRSSLFDNETLFPLGSIQLDNALLMRGVAHEWHGREDLCCNQVVQPASTEPAVAQAGMATTASSSAGKVSTTSA